MLENKKIKISGIEIYHSQNYKHIDEYIKEFESIGKDIEFQVREFLGKEILYTCEGTEENSLTMGIEAAKKVLKSTGIDGSDIDMVVFSSVFPEYVVPPSATFIHAAINGKDSAICYDINVNCIGMTFAMTQVYRQMEADMRFKKVLLVGCDYLTMTVDKTNELIAPNVGDVACAIILERTEEESGLLDVAYRTNKETIDKAAYPRCGSSHIYEASKAEILSKFELEDLEVPFAEQTIRSILKAHQLTTKDVKMYCLSQYAVYTVLQLREQLEIPDEKALYVADKYGYSGTTSPFLVLYEAVQQKKIKRGDYILFWTVGAATQHIFALIRY